MLTGFDVSMRLILDIFPGPQLLLSPESYSRKSTDYRSASKYSGLAFSSSGSSGTLCGCHGDGESAKLDAHRSAFSGGLYSRVLE